MINSKQPSECRNDIVSILTSALESGKITKTEYTLAMESDDWQIIQPILDKAQQVSFGSSSESDWEDLKQYRSEHPLHASSFTIQELEKLKTFAPEEAELLAPSSGS